MSNFALTTEQLAAIDANRRGIRRLKIEALAGTGKTSTLVELAKDMKVRKSRQRTLYVAFNNYVVDEIFVPSYPWRALPMLMSYQSLLVLQF